MKKTVGERKGKIFPQREDLSRGTVLGVTVKILRELDPDRFPPIQGLEDDPV